MEPFDFAAGLRVVGAGMFVDDSTVMECCFERVVAAAVLGGEDCAVVGEH